MSLVALASRACTYLALRGATWAGDCVYESKLEPIDVIVQAETQPFITIAIDEASGEPKGHGASLLAAVDRLLLVIEIAVGVRALADDGSTIGTFLSSDTAVVDDTPVALTLTASPVSVAAASLLKVAVAHGGSGKQGTDTAVIIHYHNAN